MEAFDRKNQDLIMISVPPLSAETVRLRRCIKNIPKCKTDVCEANINRLFVPRPQARCLYFLSFFLSFFKIMRRRRVGHRDLTGCALRGA